MNIVKVIQPDNGWDSVICIADSIEAAAFELECESVHEFYEQIDKNGWIVREVVLATLPKGFEYVKD